MKAYDQENLSHDPIHGYIAFTSASTTAGQGEASERQLIDNPWLQRLRQIHQLQTAWWVFPSAEHTRFPHVIGAMHLGSRVGQLTYDTLAEQCPDCPSRGYVECLLRLAGLLHDVGHGPFGHFFDEHFLQQFNETHETVGAKIIQERLADLIRGIRRNPYSALRGDERLDPQHVARLIVRPGPQEQPQPRWLTFLRAWLSGIYTIDNMDFVLRDAYMSGYSQRAFDLDRLLHYTFFSPQGLTIYDRGLDALMRFLTVRAELFRNIYFHRTVRAIDLTLADLFRESRDYLFRGNPAENLDEYLHFTEFSLLIDVRRWRSSRNPKLARLGERWHELLERRIPWKMVCQRSLVFTEQDSEKASIFSNAEVVEKQIRQQLPAELRAEDLRVDIARHIYRPHTRGPALGQNFLFDSARQTIVPLIADRLYRQLPVSYRICRIYARTREFASQIAQALDHLLGAAPDDLTNM